MGQGDGRAALRQLRAVEPGALTQLVFLKGHSLVLRVQVTVKPGQKAAGEAPGLTLIEPDVFDRQTDFLHDLPADRALQRLADLSALPCTYFFSIDDIAFHWCHVVPSAILDAAVPAKNGQFRDMQPGWLAFACITASQLYDWYHNHQFCGRCGAPAQQDAVERAMRCPACGGLVYPTISPAVIVAVTHGDRLLLTK